MKETPILYTGSNVRAILEDRKSQTRRLLKPQPHAWKQVNPTALGNAAWTFGVINNGVEQLDWKCPYGQPGDRLWVKETWRPYYEEETGASGLLFRAGGYKETRAAMDVMSGNDHWKPSIFMPRWASRITLEITEIRVERLQDISEDDAVAEGCKRSPITSDEWVDTAYGKYEELWEQINGPGSWDLNSWVWVIGFKRV